MNKPYDRRRGSPILNGCSLIVAVLALAGLLLFAVQTILDAITGARPG